MSARTGKAYRLSRAELDALERARARFITWHRDWAGASAFDPKALAVLRKAARAFHMALAPMLAPSANDGTRARLLLRMQEQHQFQKGQGAYTDELCAALRSAYAVDGACEREVQRGTKVHMPAHAWVWFAADEWTIATGKAPTAGRFADALQNYTNRDVPAIGGLDQVKTALSDWRLARKGQ